MATVLNSWKEIAAYLGRGVRTAQRWERELALPVRRPRGKDRSAVFAVPGEIDGWLAKCPPRAMGTSEVPVTVAAVHVVTAIADRAAPEKLQQMHRNADRLFTGTEMLHERMLRLQQQVERAMLMGRRLTVLRNREKNPVQLPSAS